MKSNLENMSIDNIRGELIELESISSKSSIILSSMRALTKELEKRKTKWQLKQITTTKA